MYLHAEIAWIMRTVILSLSSFYNFTKWNINIKLFFPLQNNPDIPATPFPLILD